MRKLVLLTACHILLLGTIEAQSASIATGAAPKGDAQKVAGRIIKKNFPECRRVTKATRLNDGSIQARCDGIDYHVFTVYNPEEGKVLELALNCKAAKELGVSCN